MLTIKATQQFKRDFKLAIKRGYNPASMEKVVNLLANEVTLPPTLRDHRLTSSKHYTNARECHIAPDWLLVYRIDRGELILELIRTGSHSDLFR